MAITKKAKRIVIADDNLRSFSPLWKLLTLWLVLDKVQAPSWAMGAFFMLAIIVMGAYFYNRADEESKSIDGFGGGK